MAEFVPCGRANIKQDAWFGLANIHMVWFGKHPQVCPRGKGRDPRVLFFVEMSY
jgi:hypothetical protein